jgi:hypothetical protein
MFIYVWGRLKEKYTILSKFRNGPGYPIISILENIFKSCKLCKASVIPWLIPIAVFVYSNEEEWDEVNFTRNYANFATGSLGRWLRQKCLFSLDDTLKRWWTWPGLSIVSWTPSSIISLLTYTRNKVSPGIRWPHIMIGVRSRKLSNVRKDWSQDGWPKYIKGDDGDD